MPPPGSTQPEQAAIDQLIAWLEQSIDDDAADTVGFVQAQRLSRTEYAHAVKGLLGIEIDAAEYLPTEIEVDGFTNIAAGLTVSPAFIEQYISAAGHRRAFWLSANRCRKLQRLISPPPSDNQQAYIDGMPLGTRGGVKFTHNFPADGEYRVTVTNLGAGLYPRSLENGAYARHPR